MEIQTNLKDILNCILDKEPALLYFSGENCSVCKALKPKIGEEIKANFKKFKLIEIKTENSKEISSYFSVFTIPTILVFFDGKECKREGRNLSVPAFITDLQRLYSLMFDTN